MPISKTTDTLSAQTATREHHYSRASSVTVVDHAAFHDCTSLKDVTVSDGVKIIGDWGFGGCSSLTNIVIPSSVERIDRAAFYNCSSLKEVTIPENMTVLDECIFQGCTSLTSLTVPPNITTIRNEFVDSCNSLSCIVFEGNAPVVTEKAFIGFGGKILVSKQSSGWCLDIPGIWNGVFVNYDDYVPPIGTGSLRVMDCWRVTHLMEISAM